MAQPQWGPARVGGQSDGAQGRVISEWYEDAEDLTHAKMATPAELSHTFA